MYPYVLLAGDKCCLDICTCVGPVDVLDELLDSKVLTKAQSKVHTLGNAGSSNMFMDSKYYICMHLYHSSEQAGRATIVSM